jgi:hypothetical protein
MRTQMAVATAFLLVFTMLPTICFAGAVGKITGKVVNSETGEPLEHANVEILGTRLGAMALEDGSYLILNVTPGRYDLRASFIGYKPLVITGVIVEPDLTQTIDFELEQTAIEVMEPIVVEAQRPLVKVDVTSTRSIFLAEEVAALLVDNPVNVINFVSGSTVDAGGTHIRGGRETEVGYYIDDTPIQDPIQNNAILNLSNQSVNEMVVFTGGFNAEYGNASSGIVNIITSEGSDEFRGSVEHRMYLPLQMFWIDTDTGDPLETGESRQRFTLTGPIFKGERGDVKFSVAGETTQWDDWQPRVERLDRPGSQKLLDATLTFRSRKTVFKGAFNFEREKHVSSYDSYRLYERLLVPDTWRHTENENYRFAFSGSHMLSANSFVRGSFSVLDAEMEIAQPGKKWDPSLTYQENQDLYDLDLDIRRDENNFITSGDNPYYDHQKKRIYALRGSYTHQTGRNELKGGLDLNFFDVQEVDVFASTQNYYIYTFDVQPRAGAMYLQDKIEFEGLIMNLGARFDFFDPNHKVFKDFDHPYDPDAPDSLWHGPNNDQAPIEKERYDSEGNYLGGGLKDADVKWKLSPRLGISYSTCSTAISSRCRRSTTCMRMKNSTPGDAGS